MSPLRHFLNIFQINEKTKPRNVFFLLLLNTAIIFSPFLTLGKILLSDTDSLFGHYPNLFFAKEAWGQGSLGLWNPYLFAGIDFTATMHNHGLSPAFWPVFLFPKEYLLHALTLLLFSCHLIIGWTAFQIGRLYLQNHYAAFLALSFQLSGFVWFTTTSTIGVPMCAASLISIYLILKAPSKPIFQTLIPLSLTLPIITLMGHGGYIIAFLFPPFVVTLIIFWPKSLKGWFDPRLWAIGITFALALGLGGFRLMAVSDFLLQEAASSESLFGYLSNLVSNFSYYLLTALIPNFIGYKLAEGAAISGYLYMGKLHNQFHISLYYGMILFPIVTGAALALFGRKAQYAAIAFLIFFAAHPIGLIFLTDIVEVLLYPFHHKIVTRVFAPFAMGIALYLVLFYIQNHKLTQEQIQKLKISLFLLFGIVIALVSTFYFRLLQSPYHDSGFYLDPIYKQHSRKMIFILKFFGMACLGFFLWIAHRMTSHNTNRIMKNLVHTSIVLGGLIYAGLALFLFSQPETYQTHLVFYGFVYEVAASLWAVILLWMCRKNSWGSAETFRLPTTVLIALGIMIVFLLLPIPTFQDPRNYLSFGFASVASVARFMIVGACAIEIFCSLENKSMSRPAWLALILLFSFGEMHCFQKIYSHVGASPFEQKSQVYPDIQSPLTTPISEKDRQIHLTAKNLLFNPNLERNPNSPPEGWFIGGRQPVFSSFPVEGETIFSLTNKAGDLATVFQDIEWKNQTGPIAVGVWIKSKTPGKSGILAKGEILYKQNSNKWKWIQTTFSVEKGETFRIHLYQKGPGHFEFMGLRLIQGFFVEPSIFPPGPKIEPALMENTDLRQYRVNRSGNFPEINMVFSSIPMVHHIPSYGGVDSVVKKDLADFLVYFEDKIPEDQWITRFGILSIAQNPRLLDLLSVRYDVESPSTFKVRKNALARFSLFDNFEVHPEKKDTLARLADPRFDPTRTVILDRDPGWKRISSKSLPRFTVADFESPNFQEINITTQADHPHILLFNDVYSKHWKATWNGQPIPLLKANGIFMAVSLPSGQGKLELTFDPAKFKAWMKTSYVTLAGLWVIFLVQVAYRRLNKPPAVAHSI